MPTLQSKMHYHSRSTPHHIMFSYKFLMNLHNASLQVICETIDEDLKLAFFLEGVHRLFSLSDKLNLKLLLTRFPNLIAQDLQNSNHYSLK